MALAQLPGWKAEILEVTMAGSAPAGTSMVAEVVVRNIGAMSWTVPVGHWPFLNLGFRLLDESGELLQLDGYRFPVPSRVPPRGEVLFIAPFNTPIKKAFYWLEWDMVSESECWFQECGSQTRRTPLQIY